MAAKKAQSRERDDDYHADLLAHCQKLLDSGELSPAEEIKTIAEMRALRAHVERRRREANRTITDRDIAKSVAWGRIRGAIGEALKPYPDALGAVLEAIKNLDAV